jgi:hypothetical protein
MPSRSPAGRRTRLQRWHAAVAELLALQAECAAWLDALPETLRLGRHRGGPAGPHQSRFRRACRHRAAARLRAGLNRRPLPHPRPRTLDHPPTNGKKYPRQRGSAPGRDRLVLPGDIIADRPGEFVGIRTGSGRESALKQASRPNLSEPYSLHCLQPRKPQPGRQHSSPADTNLLTLPPDHIRGDDVRCANVGAGHCALLPRPVVDILCSPESCGVPELPGRQHNYGDRRAVPSHDVGHQAVAARPSVENGSAPRLGHRPAVERQWPPGARDP